MLRASSLSAGEQLDLRAITDRAVDPLIEGGTALLAFVTALVRNDTRGLDAARDDLRATAGAAAVVRASAVAGNFQMMNRLVDATGVPIGASMRSIAIDLGLPSARGE